MKQHRRKKKKSSFSWLVYVGYLVVVAVFALAMAVYSLPFVAYYQVASAIATKDAGKLASNIDFQEMRKNLKAQKGNRVIKHSQKKQGTADLSLVDLSISWSSLSSDHDIDRAISNEGFYVVFNEGNAKSPVLAAPETSPYSFIRKLVDTSSFQYRSLSEFVVSVKDEEGRYAEYFSFIFQREGLTWRLTKVVLPVF